MFEVEEGIPVPAVPMEARHERPPIETHTCRQAMDILNIGHSTLYRLFADGELMPIKVGSKTLILGLREFIDRKAAEARASRAVN